MKGLGEGIAFCGLVIGTVYLEVNEFHVMGLWALIVIWVIFSDWGQKDKEKKPNV